MQSTVSMTDNIVTNFMGGESYKLNPLQSMQIVCTSMICGEAQYYRAKKDDKDQFKNHFLFQMFYGETESSNDYFTTIVSAALDYDFPGTLAFIEKLRNEYFMRLNSHFLITQAVHHPKRIEFNKKNPKVFRKAIEDACNIPTDWTSQYKLLKESGKPIPTIWKKAIADQLQKMSCYHAAKYIHGSKTQGKTDKMLANIVDLIRITHPKPNDLLNDLVKHGKVLHVADDEQTWEKLKSAGKTWVEINAQIRLPHMALLRNLSNILDEYATLEDQDATSKIKDLVARLIAGVKGGKQFPFRYYSAHKRLTGNQGEVEVQSRKRSHKSKTASPGQDDEPAPEVLLRTPAQQELYLTLRSMVLDGLNQCLLESLETIPALPGRVDCLSDNSGSARGGMVSEYGTVNVYEISNLSAILSAFRSTEGGSVWVFGDRLEEYKVSKTRSILTQLNEVNAIGNTIGGGTETGVWLFWEKVIKESVHLDNVFIYSDMQAGTGQLYASNNYSHSMLEMNCTLSSYGQSYINVLSLVNTYRSKVNPKTNVFSVQVAGYNNSILPDILYRGALLSGWTGKEARMAYEISQLWDQIEATQSVSPAEETV
uniref:TROVE domain-containing protein n=1 Tax=viral metagenome TaxID=1070528 RepID=A0A6C0HH23_9ZZZZ